MRSKQLGDLVTTCRRTYIYDFTARLFCNKFQKGWDVKNVALARKQHEISILKAQLEAARPSKRRKVQMDPKTLFVDIQDVGRTYEQVAGNSSIPEESLVSNNNSNTTDILNVNELGSEIDE